MYKCMITKLRHNINLVTLENEGKGHLANVRQKRTLQNNLLKATPKVKVDQPKSYKEEEKHDDPFYISPDTI